MPALGAQKLRNECARRMRIGWREAWVPAVSLKRPGSVDFARYVKKFGSQLSTSSYSVIKIAYAPFLSAIIRPVGIPLSTAPPWYASIVLIHQLTKLATQRSNFGEEGIGALSWLEANITMLAGIPCTSSLCRW